MDVDPYQPPKGEITPPQEPEPPERDDRPHYARGVAAIGVVIVVRMAWESRWGLAEGFIGALCMGAGLGALWRIRRKAK